MVKPNHQESWVLFIFFAIPFAAATLFGPIYGFEKIFTTDGFAGIFWQIYTALLAVFLGVPAAMRASREMRREEDGNKLEELCILFHNALEENIRLFDNAVIPLVDGDPVSIQMNLRHRSHPDWHRLQSLVLDPIVLNRIYGIENEWIKFNEFIQALDSSSDPKETGKFACSVIGGPLWEAYFEFRKTSEWGEIIPFASNGGMNGRAIRVMGLLEKFMKSQGHKFTHWCPERVTEVVKGRGHRIYRPMKK